MQDDGRNLNPVVYRVSDDERVMAARLEQELDPEIADEIDALEIFDMIRYIDDPEHPNSLEELKVVYPQGITVSPHLNTVSVQFTPTIPNCGMATLIGLMIRVKLHRSLPSHFKVDIRIEKGKHQQEVEINKQLNDKERVLAALEQPNLLTMVNKGLTNAEKGTEIYLSALKINF